MLITMHDASGKQPRVLEDIGCTWLNLPGEFPSWQTVYWYYDTWVNINRSLVADRGYGNY